MGVYLLDILFVIGLPRSGTSLVHKLVHQESGRKAPTFRSFGIDVSDVPRAVRELNKTFTGPESLAEDNDFPGDLRTYRTWLETRGDKWVCKSPDHLGRLAYLWHEFPEARFLWCMRPAGPTLSSIREYWQVTGLGPEYNILKAVRESLEIARAFPEKFDCIWTPSIPEWETDREPILSPEQGLIDIAYSELRGLCRNVTSDRFSEYYS